MAVGQAAGSAVRRRPGAFRTIFNVGNHFLADTAAWLVFSHAVRPGSGAIALALGGAAGARRRVDRQPQPPGRGRLVWPANRRTSGDGCETSSARCPSPFSLASPQPGRPCLYRDEGDLRDRDPAAAPRTGSGVAWSRWRGAPTSRRWPRRHSVVNGRGCSAARPRRSGGRATPPRWSARGSPPTSTTASSRTSPASSSAPAPCWAVSPTATPSIWSREGVETFLNYTRDLAAEAVRELRTLMVELAPPLLDEEGLSSALRQLLSRLDRDHISWVLECTEEQLDQRQQRLVYRVIQEALRNVVKHAQCHTVWVTVRTESDRLLVSIRDDGRGFSAAERAEQPQEGPRRARPAGPDRSRRGRRALHHLRSGEGHPGGDVDPDAAAAGRRGGRRDGDGATVDRRLAASPSGRRRASGGAGSRWPGRPRDAEVPDARGPRPRKPRLPGRRRASGR